MKRPLAKHNQIHQWRVATILFLSASILFFCCAAQADHELSGSQQLKSSGIQLTPEELAWLEAHPDIVLGYNNSFEPAAIVDPDGSYRGIVVDFLDALNKRLGIHIALQIDSVPIAQAKAEAKETDGIALIHPNYAEKLGFLKTKTYYRNYPVVFGHSDISFEQPVDFVGKKVAIIDKVYFSERIIEPYKDRATVLKVKDAQEGLDLVLRKKVELFLGGSANNYFITKYRLYGVTPKYMFLDTDNKFGMAIRPDWPILVSILNKGISSFSEEELEAIAAKWIQPLQQEKQIELTPEEEAWLAAHPDIQLFYTDAVEPDVIANPDGSYTGIIVDFLDELNRRLGTRMTLRIDSIAEVLQKVQKKEVDGIPSLLPDYADKLGLLNTDGYLPAYPAVFTRRNDSFAGPEDFVGKKVAIIDKIFFSEKLIQQYGKQSKILKVKDALDGFKSVIDGEADFFVGLSVYSYYLSKYQLYGIVTKYVFLDYQDKFAMGVRPEWPELVTILNKGIASFSQNEIDTIVSKWTHLPQQEKQIELTAEDQAWLEQNHAVQVYMVNIPPFITLKEGAEPEGISIDYLKLIAERTGVKFKYVVSGKTFPEALEGINKHQGPDLITPMVRTPEREKSFLFSKNYFTSPDVIFTHTNDKSFLSDLNVLSGRKVALMKGTVLHEKIMAEYPSLKLELFDNDAQAIEAVATQTADAYIGNLTLASSLMLEKGFTNMKIAGPSPFGDRVFAMGVRNDWPELASIIDKGLASITADEIAQIRSKHLAIRYEHTEASVIARWVIIIGSAASGIVLLFILWNTTLRRKVRQRTAELKGEIAERERAKNELVKSEEQYRSLVDNAIIGVFKSQRDGQILFVNEAMVRMFDFVSAEEMVAENPLLRWADPARREEWFAKLYENGSVSDFEAETLSAVGRRVHVLISATLVGDTVAGMIIDISQRKEDELKVQTYQDRLKSLASKLTLAKEQERRHIAVELHDNVAQTLALSRLQLATAAKSVEDPQLRTQLDQLSQTLLKTAKDTRHLIFEHSSPPMNELSLGRAIGEWLEAKQSHDKSIDFKLVDHLKADSLDENLRAILFRNLRELLTNTIKHARAKKVTLQLEKEDNKVRITLCDNGIGFDPESVMYNMTFEGGFGLFSIQENMKDLGGALEIKSSPHQGCTMILTAPCHITTGRTT